MFIACKGTKYFWMMTLFYKKIARLGYPTWQNSYIPYDD
jgi:hypothetical protein